MIRFRFGHEDLVRTRFAISPLFDLTWSTDVLRDPAAHSLHLPWARAARRRLEGFDFTLLELLATVSAHGYAPDFVVPPPSTPLAELADELARVRATPHQRVALEVGWRFEGAEVPAAARVLLDDPERGLAELTALMADYFERAIEPWWPSKLPWMSDCMAGSSSDAPRPPRIAQKMKMAARPWASVIATAPTP